MFVTCFYAVLDPKSGSLTYANAGHNLPCCCHEDATSDLSARGMPLGLMPGMDYEEKETVLVPGESVLFYTDGLIEAHNRRQDRRRVGRERFISRVAAAPPRGEDRARARRAGAQSSPIHPASVA